MSECSDCRTCATAPEPEFTGPAARPKPVALIGPPNSGKTTLFNRLTGLRQKVANFPGVTVEQHSGMAELPDGQRKRLMERRAVEYLDLAFRYAIQFARPTLWVMCGMAGTGKSTFGERLREIFNIVLLRSDEARKELPGYGGPAPFGTGIYRPEMRGHIYSRLLSMAQEELKNGRSVILDATFSRQKWREEALRLAQDLDANILFFECVSSPATIRERLGRRRQGESGGSDARVEHLPGLIDEFENLSELAPEQHARINTEDDIEANLRTILSSAYSKKRTQIERIIAKL